MKMDHEEQFRVLNRYWVGSFKGNDGVLTSGSLKAARDMFPSENGARAAVSARSSVISMLVRRLLKYSLANDCGSVSAYSIISNLSIRILDQSTARPWSHRERLYT
jgi:hypothetical protein